MRRAGHAKGCMSLVHAVGEYALPCWRHAGDDAGEHAGSRLRWRIETGPSADIPTSGGAVGGGAEQGGVGDVTGRITRGFQGDSGDGGEADELGVTGLEATGTRASGWSGST